MADFTAAFHLLMGNEGGYSQNLHDPGNWTGGAIGKGVCIGTVWGLSAPVLVRHGVAPTPQAVRVVPQSQAFAIAKAEYWDVYQCDAMPQAVAFQVLDAAYNGGHPADWLRMAVGLAPGKVDAATLQALDCHEVGAVVARFIAYRLRYWTSLSSWSEFGKGWANRAASDLLQV